MGWLEGVLKFLFTAEQKTFRGYHILYVNLYNVILIAYADVNGSTYV